MKKIVIIFGVIFLLNIVSSCTKFLDTKPQDFLTPVNFYDTKDQLDMALASVYSSLTPNMYGNRIVRNGLDADDGFYDRDSDPFGVSTWNVSASDPSVRGWWVSCYDGINKANLLLANINKPTMPEAERAAIEGQAKFLRGYFFFLLVTNFGAVPLPLVPTEVLTTTAIPRVPIAEVYAQIILDMEDAETKVNTAAKVGFGGRINKSAVRGILARVNLHMAGMPLKDESRYAEALKWAKVVKDDPFHQLNTDYSQVFINISSDKYDVKEVIWEAELYGNTQDVWRESGQIGTWASPAYSGADPNLGLAYGFLNPTGVLWDKYDNKTSSYSRDLRRDWAICPFVYIGNPAVKIQRPITEIYQRDAGKYRREYEVLLPKENQYSTINFPILRFSDVLLMFAEADNFINNGPSQEAIDAINMVRRRGYGKYLNGIGSISESIMSFIVTNGGAGFTSTPVVTITGGGGEEATARVARTGGVITGIFVDNPGKKFTSAPTVTITGGGGSGASALAVLTPANSADFTVDQFVYETFLETLQDERSRELCFEGLRKGDLVRWGIMLRNMKFVLTHANAANLPSRIDYAKRGYENAGPRDVLWPIPASELAVNSALTQNPGW